MINDDNYAIWLVVASIFLLGIIGAIIIYTYIKRLLFHMEPEEISELLLQKEAILQSTKEGIIALNQKGETVLVNKAAKDIFSLDQGVQQTDFSYIFSNLEDTAETDVEMVDR